MSISNSSSFLSSQASNAFMQMSQAFRNQEKKPVNNIRNFQDLKGQAKNPFEIEQGKKQGYQSSLGERKEIDELSEKFEELRKKAQENYEKYRSDRISGEEIQKAGQITQRKLTAEEIKLQQEIIDLARTSSEKKFARSREEFDKKMRYAEEIHAFAKAHKSVNHMILDEDDLGQTKNQGLGYKDIDEEKKFAKQIPIVTKNKEGLDNIQNFFNKDEVVSNKQIVTSDQKNIDIPASPTDTKINSNDPELSKSEQCEKKPDSRKIQGLTGSVRVSGPLTTKKSRKFNL